MIDTADYSWARLVLAICAVVIALCYVIMCCWAYIDRRNRPPKLSWIIAGGMALAAFSLAGAGVVLTEGAIMPAKIAAEEKAEAAFALQRAGHFEKAIDGYLEADGMGADPRRALYRAAECALYLKRYDESLHLCDALAARVPHSGAAHYVRGLVFEAQGELKAAREQWELAKVYHFAPASRKLGEV